jgi:hypothetical protein
MRAALLVSLALALALPSCARAQSAPADSGVAKPAAAATGASSAAKPRADAGPRTLQDIHIEGEVPVPQVLFVTARDQRRLTEFQHRRYLKNSLGVGRSVAMPSRIAVSPATASARKESSR